MLTPIKYEFLSHTHENQKVYTSVHSSLKKEYILGVTKIFFKKHARILNTITWN